MTEINICIPEKNAIKVNAALYIMGEATVLPIPGNDTEGILKNFDKPVSYQYLANAGCIDKPDLQELMQMAFDGVCLSVAGKITEPDGHDENGFPSWMLALNII